jgi:hypothetical protein
MQSAGSHGDDWLDKTPRHPCESYDELRPTCVLDFFFLFLYEN